MTQPAATSTDARVLAIGGLDPTGGAGVTADARMLQSRGVHAATVATALTDQDRHGFRGFLPVPDDWLERLLAAALADGPVHAIKTGLFGHARAIAVAARVVAPLLDRGVPLVVDPVLAATAGGWEAEGELVAAYRELLLPRARLVTPNLPELATLAAGAPQRLLELGCGAVLVKGGHAEAAADGAIEDQLVRRGDVVVFRHPRVATGPLHGTGCALASAVAAELALAAAAGQQPPGDEDLERACRVAVETLGRCIRASRHDGALPEPLRLA
jgi:hydroxymethylpyrimidine/phosphomethylpyrimidine kinase